MSPAAAAQTFRPSIATVAICTGDRALRDRLARLVGGDATLLLAGAVADVQALARLVEKGRIGIVLIDAMPAEQLLAWSRRHHEGALVAIVDESHDDTLAALRAGARTVLSRTASDAEIALTVSAAARGLSVLPAGVVDAWQAELSMRDVAARPVGDAAELTSREREVLAAMADGCSNKAIARRLGISFHTVKFHVAGILAKLDADSRTEAVAKAAQLGLVML